jgi:hypothetical protein
MTSPELISLPSHILIEITSYLPPPTLKALCQTHQVLREIAEIHLYEKIRLPLSNPYYAVQDQSSNSGMVEYRPVKPFLAETLESLGWKEDTHRSGHLDSSLLYLIPLLKGREGYVKKLVIDLKDRYHDSDLDMDTYWKLTNLNRQVSSTPNPSDEPKPLHDPISELDNLRLHLSSIRQAESPLHNPHLAKTIRSFPILPAVTKVTMTIYESYTGYLPYLLPLLPNLQELIIHPHELLVESPLSFPELKGVEVRLLEGIGWGLVEDWEGGGVGLG